MGGANTALGRSLDRGGARLLVRQVGGANTDLGWSLGKGLVLFLDRQAKKKMLVAQACPTRCDPIDCSPAGSSVHGNLQARMLEWVDIPFSRASSQPRD